MLTFAKHYVNMPHQLKELTMSSRATPFRLTGLAAAACFCLNLPAHAQQATPSAGTDDKIERVEITALKKLQGLQEVAASVTAITADDLSRSGIVNSADLQQKVPGLSLSWGGREHNVAIRGVSNNVRSLGADPSNAVHLDGVYLPRSAMVLTELFDLQRVEVLKGPEGTLYGRNATGGAINVISRAPSAGTQAEGFVGLGTNSLRRTQLAAGGGTDEVSGRIAVAYTKDNGYTRNIANNTNLDVNDFSAIRGKVRFALGSSADLTLMLQSSNDKGTVGYGTSTNTAFSGPAYPYALNDPDYKLTAADHRTDPRHIRLDSPITSSRKSTVVAATLNWDFGAVGLKSITAGTKFDSADNNDVDWTGAKLETQATTTGVKSYSQEVQIYSQSGGPLDWTAGIFLYKDEGSEFLNWQLSGAVNCGTPVSCDFAKQNVNSKSTSSAVFGQATYKLDAAWSAVLGGRYTSDKKDGDATNLRRGTSFAGSFSFSAFTPKAQIQWTPQRNLMAYVGVSKGFKSGGWNFGATGIGRFEPEKIIAYEGGVRSTLMGGGLVLNASVFKYDYTDLQLRTAILDATGGRFIVSVNNAAKASINGIELSAESRLGAGFTLGFAGAYIDSALKNYIAPATRTDLGGMQLPLTPKLSGSLSLDHDTAVWGGSLRSRVELNGRSSVIFPLTLDQKNNTGEGHGLVNASMRWSAPKDRYYVQFGMQNATDKLYRTMRADYAFSNVVESFGAPRTFEIRLGFKI